jgi:hypothetical protein
MGDEAVGGSSNYRGQAHAGGNFVGLFDKVK